ASDLAAEATKEALRDAGVEPDEIDCIIFATLSPDHNFPGSGCFLQQKLGLAGIPALDIRNQCSGFLYGLAVADSWIRTGMYRRILLAGAEVHSTGLDKSTRGRDVACLFGDGAGVVVLGPDESGESGILAVRLHADGRYAKNLWLEAPASRYYPARIDEEMIRQGRHFPKMEGRRVFVEAVRKMPEVIGEVLDACSLGLSDVDLFVPHQANQRITEAVAKKLGLPEEKVFSNIEKVGNTTAASIPLCLSDAQRQGRLKRGDLVCMASFGAGFTWAAALVRW
ncbi:MAG: beta-ketoacyl-ACP synthase 3, partial [Deltaproteobacteria bacterium]